MTAYRTTTTLAATLLLIAAAVVHAQPGEETNVSTEWLSYAGTNNAIPGVPIIGDVGPFIVNSPCDQAGVGGVRFCETLQQEELPDQVAINVRDDLGLRVGFYYELSNTTTGDVLWQGHACGHVNTFVPHLGTGFTRNADQLTVTPDIVESGAGETTALHALDEELPTPCGSTGTIGTVVVTWRYNAPMW